METVIAALVGAILYFLFEYRTKSKQGFSIKFWVKDNWYNIVLMSVCLVAYVLYVDANPTKTTAFFLGFGGNKIIDYFDDMRQNFKLKS